MQDAYAGLATEQPNENTGHIDEMSTADMVRLFNEQDKCVAPAVERVLDAVSAAIDRIAACLNAGGRLFYLGAGTSGRLGVLDASECPPTYGVDPETVQGLMVGGEAAVFRAVEGAEDDPKAGILELQKRNFGPGDALAGLSASGHAPSVVAAVTWARALGAATVAVACNPGTPLTLAAEIAIVPQVGPEVIQGSTRMKAGTAQKMVLNMLSTGVMVRTGRVYRNYMVGMKPTNQKLRQRALRILCAVTQAGMEEAEWLLDAAGGDIRRAIVLHEAAQAAPEGNGSV